MTIIPAFTDFQPVAAVPAASIDKYRTVVSDEIVSIWEQFGYGTALSGFLKIVDPDRYLELLDGCFPRPNMIPVFATGMGDIIVAHEGGLRDLKYRHQAVGGLGHSTRHWPIYPEELMQQDFAWRPYPAAVERYGPLGYDECFGFVPLLALGGPERVENLEKVRIFEHLQLITQLTGPIDY